ncbi:DUF1579 domain-containing protein [Rhizobium panacihumi]|uniref:DUF1579 domain-containing protein n=1 Tax=Rhizobium panacihumi TaxID=2008450 RepID=UPI003D7A13EE
MSEVELYKPQTEHFALERMVGTWDVKSSVTGPDANWTEKCRSLDGMWYVAEGEGDVPGGTARTVLTVGYDPDKRKYVGTWIGSMVSMLWVYEGEFSGDGNTLSLHTTGPDCEIEGRIAEYREQIIFQDNDHRFFTSATKQPDGSWKTFQDLEYTRKR